MRLVIVQGDAVEHRQGLALAAGGEKGSRSAGRSCQRSLSVMKLRGRSQVAQFRGDLAVANHAAAAQHDAPVAALGDIDDLLDSRDAR